MARRSKRPELEMRVSFEVTRIAPQCLAEAYERLVLIPRRPARPLGRSKVPRGPVTAYSDAKQPGIPTQAGR